MYPHSGQAIPKRQKASYTSRARVTYSNYLNNDAALKPIHPELYMPPQLVFGHFKGINLYRVMPTALKMSPETHNKKVGTTWKRTAHFTYQNYPFLENFVHNLEITKRST